MTDDLLARHPEVVVPTEPSARRRRPVRWLAVPLSIYAASRVVQLALIAWLLPPDGTTVNDRLMQWDAGWYVEVARHGYPHRYSYGPDGQLVGNGLAFLPGYPLLVRVVHEITRLDYRTATLLAAFLAGAGAAVAVYALGAHLYDARVGACLAALFCAQPMSAALSMAYSEGLFVAFAAGALLAGFRRAWLTAGGLGLAAALTRPTGAAVAVALALAAVMALRAGERPRWRPIAAALVALAALPAYLAWVGLRVGTWHAWFDIQTAGWGSTFDGGSATVSFVTRALRGSDEWVAVSVALLVIASVVAAVVALTTRVWPPLVAYGLLALVLVLGQGGYYHSKPRLLVPVFTLLVPAAVVLGRARARTAVPVLVGWAAFGLWYGAYLITVWRYAI